MKKPLAVGAALALVLLWGSCSAADQDARRIAEQLCASCHGLGGNSVSPIFPRLDAQTAPYIEAQLKTFRNHERGDSDARAFMWGMASQLDDATIKALAAYYAAQPAPPGATEDPALAGQGKEIFDHGISATGVPACASCHGAKGQGNDAFPRLAGQHIDYLVRQLQFFKKATRANAPVMVQVAHSLTLQEMRAVAVYLRTQ